ncbi:MAG: PGN_0703 family putative restriction endonuclease [Candidatus Helarchaeota archaeon]
MVDKKRKFIEYLNENISRFTFVTTHPGIKAVLHGDFSNLPENPSDDAWHVLALMIDGYTLSEHLGLGEMLGFVSSCLQQYKERGILPKKSIELWICLLGLQRSEHFLGRPLEGDDRQFVSEIYSELRKNLLDTEGVGKMIKSLEINDYGRYRNDLIHRYWRYQEKEFQPVEEFFDQPNNDNERPPVFLKSEAKKNILTSLDSKSIENEQLFNLIPHGEHHKWFRSMNSSQALALIVLGNLFIHNKLSILSHLTDDDGRSLLENMDIAFDEFFMEHKINFLGERRRTSIDAFIPGDFQIAIECKFTENEVGSCSRTKLSKNASKYEQRYCNGSYIKQMGRKERCALTENGVKYWKYIPLFFKWDKEKDADACPLRYNYQLVRNLLAAGIKEDGSASLTNGQVILIYDKRNPACQPGGKIFRSYNETKEALLNPRMLRKISWQNIIRYMRGENILPWITKQLKEKYGI